MFKVLLIGAVCLFQATQGYYPAARAPKLRAWNDFRVKYSKTGNDGYFAMPRSLSDPLMKNYVQVPFNNKYNVKLYCYPNDPRVCLMFDKAGNVAGIQISFLKSELVHGAKTLPYDFARQGIFEATNFFNKPAWSFRAFFTNPDHLASGGTRTKTSETADSIFVKLDNKWFEVDRKEPAQGGAGHMKDFVQQSCIPGMGNHYFYKFNEQMKCEDMKAFFPMYEDGSLVSFGIMSFGEHHHLTRPWLETPSADRNPLRHVPQCFNDWSGKYGLSSLHVYLVDHPKNIDCGAYSR